LGVSPKLFAAAMQHSYPNGAWSQAAGVLSVVSRVASPGAKMRGLQAALFAIQHELTCPSEGVPPESGDRGGGAAGGDAGGEPPVMLGADELLPIVQWVLVKSDLTGLAATLVYIEQLLYRADPSADRDGPTSYCMVTFQQAILNLGRLEVDAIPEPAVAVATSVGTTHPVQQHATAQLPYEQLPLQEPT
jgi:hypothetical protein